MLTIHFSRFAFCTFSFLFSVHLSAQNAYRVDNIPYSLRPYANAVVRLSETVHTVVSPSLFVTTHRQAITVMNAQAVGDGIIVVPYSKLTQVKKLQATIYDADGRVLKKMKKSEFDDLSLIDYFSLFADDRMLRYVPQVNRFPYTVEYECELRTKTTFFLPSWRPQNRPGLAIQKSTCRFVTPVNFALRYNIHGLKSIAEQTLPNGKQKQTLWTLENVLAWRDEPLLPPVDSISPWVMTAPVNFEIDGMKGSFTNWEEYGLWYYNNMLKGRSKISDETITRVRRITEGMESQRDKARKIYEYCQQKNRYVSIQEGKTGGIRPRPADEVDRFSYGDCKALCNYTRVLLEAMDIRAYYAIVQADRRIPENPPENFANANFGNHIILCLPLDGDTVWLECTNEKAPFGYLGRFTGNRKAVLCTPEGGKIARTTVYRPEDNRQESNAQFILKPDGSLSGNILVRFTGMQYNNRDEALTTLNAERINDLKKIYGSFPDMEIRDYSLAFDRNQTVATERLQLESNRFASLNGNRMYVPVNPVNAIESPPRDLRTRTHHVFIANGFRDSDSISFVIPAGFQIENTPPPLDLNEDFGSYRFEMTVKDNIIHVYRRIQLNDMTLPSEKYNDVLNFIKKAFISDHSKIVLVKE